MKRAQTVAIPQNTWLTNILIKFKKPKFNNEKKLPLIRYTLFCIGCGLAATLFFNYNIGIQTSRTFLFNNGFIIYILWFLWFYFIARPDLQNIGLILIESSALLYIALEQSGIHLYGEIKNISVLLVWIRGTTSMILYYLAWLMLTSKDRKPPSETT